MFLILGFKMRCLLNGSFNFCQVSRQVELLNGKFEGERRCWRVLFPQKKWVLCNDSCSWAVKELWWSSQKWEYTYQYIEMQCPQRFWYCQPKYNYAVVRILNNIYSVKTYKWPVCMIEDIFHLEMVIGLVDANYLLFFKKKNWKTR